MKKTKRLGFLAVTLCLALLTLTGCGKTEVTIQQMVDANSNEALLAQSDSILSVLECSNATYVTYRAKDFRGLTTDGVYYEGCLDGHIYCCYDGVYYAAMACYDMEFNPLEENIVFNEELTSYETITETKKDGDRTILTTSVQPDKVQETLEYMGLEYTEGDSITYEYILDTETLLLYQDIITVSHTDGSAAEICVQTLTMDAEMPEIIAELYDRLTTANPQEVTIVLNPGTEEEQTFTDFFAEGDDMDVYLPDGYTALYTDAACTDLYGEADDGVVYVNSAGTLYSVQG